MLITASDLLQAWQRLAPKLDTLGGDELALQQLQANPQAWCGHLAGQVASGQYQPQPLNPIGVSKKSGGTRLLLVPPLQDRLVQSALAQQLSERLDSSFSDHSFAYRPDRGVQQACEALQTLLDQAGTAWVLDADIRNCFEQIDHFAVHALLTQRGVWQNQTALLLRQYLRSVIHPAPHLGLHGFHCLVRGLPQGSPLSPLLCNVVLDVLDHTLEAHGLHFVRYADDFVVFAADEHAITQAQGLVQATLAPLGLALNLDKTRMHPSVQGFDFLGQHFAPATPTAPNHSHSDESESRETDKENLDANHQPNVEESTQDPSDEDAQNDPLLRTLYLLEPHTTLDRDSHQLLVLAPGQDPLKIPAERLHQVMAFGSTNITSGAISLCLEMGIPVMLLSGKGRYFGLIDPLKIDNLNTQRAQFRTLDQPDTSLAIAGAMVQGKIHNQLALLRRWHRPRPTPSTHCSRMATPSCTTTCSRWWLHADSTPTPVFCTARATDTMLWCRT